MCRRAERANSWVRNMRFTCLIGLVTALVMSCLPLAAGAEPTVKWRVENPFRFFEDPADTNRHRATYDAMPPLDRHTPVLNIERHLASRHPDGWAAALSGKVCGPGDGTFDPDQNRFVKQTIGFGKADPLLSFRGDGLVEPDTVVVARLGSGIEVGHGQVMPDRGEPQLLANCTGQSGFVPHALSVRGEIAHGTGIEVAGNDR